MIWLFLLVLVNQQIAKIIETDKIFLAIAINLCSNRVKFL